MRIVAAAITPVALRLRRPLVTARGAADCRRGFLLQLVGEDGMTGVGEASPAYWIGEATLERTVADLQLVVDLVASRPDDAALRALVLSPAAMCAVDTALLDRAARAAGRAAWEMLAGEAATTADGPRATVCALVAGRTPAAVAADAGDAVAAGFRTLKIKIGDAAIGNDARAVAAVRARVGSDVALRLDANRAWTLAQARSALAALAPFAVELVEEPLRDGDAHALAALAASAPMPLALDESINDDGDVARAIAAGASPLIVIKAARIGGPTRAVALARAAARRGLDVVITDSLESAVGMGVALHVAAALASPRRPVGLGGVRLVDAAGDAETALLRASAFRTTGPGFAVVPADGDSPHAARDAALVGDA